MASESLVWNSKENWHEQRFWSSKKRKRVFKNKKLVSAKWTSSVEQTLVWPANSPSNWSISSSFCMKRNCQPHNGCYGDQPQHVARNSAWNGFGILERKYLSEDVKAACRMMSQWSKGWLSLEESIIQQELCGDKTGKDMFGYVFFSISIKPSGKLL